MLKVFILLALLPLQIWAQDYRYTLTGNFALTQEVGTTPIAFTIQWNETNGAITGAYSDNFFPGKSAVTGSNSSSGRVFNIAIQTESMGNKNLTISTPTAAPITGSVTLTLVARNEKAEVITNIETSGVLASKEPAGGELGNSCTLGFGVLTGFCGEYVGQITKLSDSFNNCSLIEGQASRLILADTTDISMNFGGNQKHGLGQLPNAPLYLNIAQVSHNCGPLPGTDFIETSCQTMTLSGNFNDFTGTKTFTGTYVILEDQTKETCTYTVNLTREL
jgi:hypothetical protein